jgi:hypothetical protein
VLLTAEVNRGSSRLANVVSTMYFAARRLGWTYSLLWLCGTVLRCFSVHIFVVTTHPIDDERGDADVNDAGLEARLLTFDDVLRLSGRDERYSRSRAFAAKAFSRGDRCVGLFEHGRLLWHCWYARGPAPVFDDLAAACEWPFLYGYRVYTDRAHRGRGLHEKGINASARIFAREGCRGFTAYIEAINLPPLIAARKMGESFVGFALVHRGVGGTKWLATPGCLKGGFRLERRQQTFPRQTRQDRRVA